MATFVFGVASPLPKKYETFFVERGGIISLIRIAEITYATISFYEISAANPDEVILIHLTKSGFYEAFNNAEFTGIFFSEVGWKTFVAYIEGRALLTN